MPQDPDDDIDEFLRSLPPAPQEWVARAEELPLLDRAAQALGEASDEASMRRALQSVGLEPDERRLRALTRLRELRRG